MTFLADLDPIKVGDLALPGKFAILPAFRDLLYCDARWIRWEARVSVTGYLRLPFGLQVLWGDSTHGDPYDTRVLARVGPIRVDVDLSREEIDEIVRASEAEAAHDAWLEMRAEQGWYDL